MLDGAVADHFIVSARTSGGPRDASGVTLFLVPRNADGVGVQGQHRVDARGAALVRLEGVQVGPNAIVGELARSGGLEIFTS